RLLAPVLVEQVAEVEDVPLYRHSLAAHGGKPLPDGDVDQVRERVAAGVARHDPAALTAEARRVRDEVLQLLRLRGGRARGLLTELDLRRIERVLRHVEQIVPAVSVGVEITGGAAAG